MNEIRMHTVQDWLMLDTYLDTGDRLFLSVVLDGDLRVSVHMDLEHKIPFRLEFNNF